MYKRPRYQAYDYFDAYSGQLHKRSRMVRPEPTPLHERIAAYKRREAALRAAMSLQLPFDVRKHIASYLRPSPLPIGPLTADGYFYSK